jgi:hypothetical protein
MFTKKAACRAAENSFPRRMTSGEKSYQEINCTHGRGFNKLFGHIKSRGWLAGRRQKVAITDGFVLGWTASYPSPCAKTRFLRATPIACKNGQTQNKHRSRELRAVKIERNRNLFKAFFRSKTRRSSFESMQMSLCHNNMRVALSLNLFNRMLASGERSP